MMKQQTTVYIPVPVEERLPEKSGGYIVMGKGFICSTSFRVNDQSFLRDHHRPNDPITQWLEEKKDMYVLSREEMEKLLRNAFNAGERFWDEDSKSYEGHKYRNKDCNQYINSILQTQNT